MTNFEKIIAAGLAWACIAGIAVMAAICIGGDREFSVAVLRNPFPWLLWPSAIGAIGGAAIQFSKQ